MRTSYTAEEFLDAIRKRGREYEPASYRLGLEERMARWDPLIAKDKDFIPSMVTFQKNIARTINGLEELTGLSLANFGASVYNIEACYDRPTDLLQSYSMIPIGKALLNGESGAVLSLIAELGERVLDRREVIKLYELSLEAAIKKGNQEVRERCERKLEALNDKM